MPISSTSDIRKITSKRALVFLTEDTREKLLPVRNPFYPGKLEGYPLELSPFMQQIYLWSQTSTTTPPNAR